MKERDLDEFGSLFQRAIIPTIEVSAIEIREIVVLADFSARAAACGRLARHLGERFQARVSVRFLLHPRDHRHQGEAQRLVEEIPADTRQLVAGDPIAHLRQVTEEEKPSLIVAPAPLHLHEETPEAAALGRIIDALLVATSIPTLLVRGTPDDSLFRRILAKIPGGRTDLIEQFSFAFALCPAGGTIRLLHVVEEGDLARLAAVLEVTPEIDTAGGAADLLAAIRARMDHLLRGAVRTARGAPFTVESAVEVGDPFAIVPVQAKDFSLLIVGSQSSHADFLASRAYELIRRLPEISVLAL
ncbi:MAG: hypothetical protein ACYTEZ_17525 [Planctomycetota bacterium]|jgi:hypothetical protein